MRRFLTLAISATTVAFIVSACGTKGPLYLPPPQSSPPAAQPAPANDASTAEQRR